MAGAPVWTELRKRAGLLPTNSAFQHGRESARRSFPPGFPAQSSLGSVGQFAAMFLDSVFPPLSVTGAWVVYLHACVFLDGNYEVGRSVVLSVPCIYENLEPHPGVSAFWFHHFCDITFTQLQPPDRHQLAHRSCFVSGRTGWAYTNFSSAVRDI